jgi:hypothetical protein
MDHQVLNSVVLVLGTLGGASIGALSQRESKKIGRLERRIDRYMREIRARQAEEETAASWLVSLGASTNVLAAKRELRRRTRQEHGISPTIGPQKMNL